MCEKPSQSSSGSIMLVTALSKSIISTIRVVDTCLDTYTLKWI